MSNIQVVVTDNAEPAGKPGAEGAGRRRGVVSRRNLFDRQIMRQAVDRGTAQVGPADLGEEPGHVRRAGRHGYHVSISIANPRRFSRGRSRSGWRTVLFANFATRWPKAAEKSGGLAAQDAHQHRAPVRLRPTVDRSHGRRGRASGAGDLVVVEAADNSSPEMAKSCRGRASIDESAITGESAPVIRECGGDQFTVHQRRARPVRSHGPACRHRQPGQTSSIG